MANKARAFLTVLGIVIGIAAVIAMLSIGQGAQSLILEQVQGLGSNTITVFPITDFAGLNSTANLQAFLTNKIDYRALAALDNPVTFPEVTAISPEVNQSFEVNYRSNSELLTVRAVSESYFGIRDVGIETGRALTQRDDDSLRKVAVLASSAAVKLFGESDPIGKQIRIDGGSFAVVGVTETKGQNFDNNVYVPLSVGTSILFGDKDFNQIVLQVADEKDIDSVAVKVEDELMDFFRITEPEDAHFTVSTSKDFLSLADTITSVFTTLLASIASISLVVGGIGIMNIMLVSVTERTKEIGLRKAVGAGQRAIMTQFLMEAVVLTLIGGLLGIIFGLSLALLVGNLGGIPVVISWQSIALATSVSAGIGLLFGFYPAWRAAKLDPIVALRYE